ncbi:alpha/beta hydrolase family protein [Microbacterium sp. MMO-113]|uniref:alpha/beta hydrolase family protein n=1 Tax=Microbacterium sp. MMO-113 TaxID=3081273 RepID=UPI003018D23C
MTPEPTPVRIEVALPTGTTTVSADWTPGTGDDVVLIAHGAGAGKDHPFLVGYDRALVALGYTTLRFSFPYAEQGRRMPGPAAHAVATWHAVVAEARARAPRAAVWATGKSYGGRMASQAVAEGLVVEGLVYLGYPLHPPGRPDKPRVAHLPSITVPQLFIEGTADPFIQPIAQLDDAVAGCQDARVHWVEGGEHSFEVKGHRRPPAEVGADIASVVDAFVAARRG